MFDAIVKVAALLLVVVFAWSGAAKVIRWSEWSRLLDRYRLGPASRVLRGAVPLGEVVVAGLIVTESQRLGAAAALALLAGFSGAVLRLRAIEGDRLPCGCFGKTQVRDYRLTLARNSFLVLLAAIVLLRGDVTLYGGLSGPSGDELVPVALIVSGIGAAVWLGVSVRRSFRRGS